MNKEMADQTQRELAALIDEHSFQAPSYSEEAAAAVLKAGWRPPAPVIETPENEGGYAPAIAELNALARGTVIKFRSYVYQSIGSGWWESIGRHRAFSTEQVVDLADGDSVTVLHTPENGDTDA